MEQDEQAILDSFTKNPDGTWTSISSTSLKVGNRVVAINEGMTFKRGEPHLFVDVAEWLDEHSK